MHPNPYSRWRMAVFVVVSAVAAVYVLTAVIWILLQLAMASVRSAPGGL